MMYLPVKRLHLQAKSLVAKFKEGGGTSFINEAIDLDRGALELCPPGNPQRHDSLTWLAVHLTYRYHEHGATRDLDSEEAIVLYREALNLYPQGHPDRSTSLNNLAALFTSRYDQLGAMRDLDEAIVLDREALDLFPQGHSDRPTSLNNLAVDSLLPI
jgi:tetratricopeptide (TPR) repeat protein